MYYTWECPRAILTYRVYRLYDYNISILARKVFGGIDQYLLWIVDNSAPVHMHALQYAVVIMHPCTLL